MLIRRFHPFFATAVVTASVLSACGGGDDGAPAPSATNSTTQSDFVTTYGNGLSVLNTTAGLTSPAFVDSIDDSYLDAGTTKTALKDSLTQEAAALAASLELSSFPITGTLSNAIITDCSAADICVLTATLSNADADLTTITFTTQVKYSGGKLRLYGDQKSS